MRCYLMMNLYRNVAIPHLIITCYLLDIDYFYTMISIPSHIKNILFDFGGVIINLNLQASVEAFMKLCGPNATISFDQWSKYGVEPAFERGELSPEEFCDQMRRLLDNPVSDQQIHDAWNAMILDLPEYRMEALESLRKKYRIFLLSNTSQIHYDLYTKQFTERYGYAHWEDLFERAWFSHEVGIRKPDAAIFHLLLDEGKIKAGETLFIDDSKANTDAAKALGFEVLHLTPDIDWAR